MDSDRTKIVQGDESNSTSPTTAGETDRPPGATFDWRETALFAAWFGLSAGLLEAAATAVRQAIFQRRLYFSAHVYWMIPAAEGAYFVVCGLLLYAVGRLLSRPVPPRATMFVLAFLGLSSPLFVFAPQLNKKASLVLATGLALQVSTMLARRCAQLLGQARRSLPWIAAGVAVIAGSVYGSRAAREWRLLRSLPTAPAGAPNVVLIVLDTVRAQSLSLYGYSKDTSPNLATFAKTGVLFERAVTPASWTLPTHASVFTGRAVHDLGVDEATPLGGTYPTLAEVMASHGYATAGFAANRKYCGRANGVDRGFAHYDEFGVNVARAFESPALLGNLFRSARRALWDPNLVPGRPAAPRVSGAFLSWLPGRADRPYFAFLNYFDAHDPFLPPPPFDAKFGHGTSVDADPDTFVRGAYSNEVVAALKAQYEGSVAYLDHEISALMEELRGRGALEKTLVIITSDHGEEFAEHGVLGHGASLYMPSLHVPLVVSMPGRVPAGRVVSEPVAVRDLGATIVHMAGLDEKGAEFPGTSLDRWWTDGARHESDPILSEAQTNSNRPKWWPAGECSLRSVVVDGFHYIRSDGVRPDELYRWDDDPWENGNLASDEKHRATLIRCREALIKLVGR